MVVKLGIAMVRKKDVGDCGAATDARNMVVMEMVVMLR